MFPWLLGRLNYSFYPMCLQIMFSQYSVQALLCWLIYHEQIMSQSQLHWREILRHYILKLSYSYCSVLQAHETNSYRATEVRCAASYYWFVKLMYERLFKIITGKELSNLSYIYRFYYFSNWGTTYLWHHYIPKLLFSHKVCVTDRLKYQEIKWFTQSYVNRFKAKQKNEPTDTSTWMVETLIFGK